MKGAEMQKNITLSAEQNLIERARRQAQAEGTTLNSEFRRWLEQYVESPRSKDELMELMRRFDYARPGKKFTRDEMNER
jgi:hypothetical protein